MCIRDRVIGLRIPDCAEHIISSLWVERSQIPDNLFGLLAFGGKINRTWIFGDWDIKAADGGNNIGFPQEYKRPYQSNIPP